MKRIAKKGYLVTLDGPSGAGKSTVSRLLAEALGGILLDTGTMYRALALLSLESGLNSPSQWSALARRLVFDVNFKSSAITVNGVDYGDRLRGEHVGAMASHISQFAMVRRVLTSCQRKLASQISKSRPVIVEGRDIGSVVFPKAPFKFYVTAEPRVRAKRRYDQLIKNGVKGVTLHSVVKEMNKRDRQDMNRKTAPLRCPKDAVVVDTSKVSIPQVVLFLKTHVESKLASNH